MYCYTNTIMKILLYLSISKSVNLVIKSDFFNFEPKQISDVIAFQTKRRKIDVSTASCLIWDSCSITSYWMTPFKNNSMRQSKKRQVILNKSKLVKKFHDGVSIYVILLILLWSKLK